MKVTLINTSDAGGGAPAACMRLLKSLALDDVDAHLLVQELHTDEPRVEAVNISHFKARFNFYYERLPFIALHEKDKTVRFAFSAANTGTDITQHELVQTADLLHLHWINSGYLSVKNLEQIMALNKPVVWTLHDMWAFTGGCHYASTCEGYLTQCGNCPMLRDASPKDLSYKGWHRKHDLYKTAQNIVFVTCSNWLAGIARTSSLLSQFRIETIPNPIDTTIFAPQSKLAARKKRGLSPNAKIILFGAANITHTRKGIAYLVEALRVLKNEQPEMTAIEVMIFGKNKGFDTSQIPFNVHELGIIQTQHQLAEIYSLADVFVLPSLEDNLPNMVMEALSCGTPVVAFNTGGIPDMVEHLTNGYLAAYRDADDMARGIHYVLSVPQPHIMSTNARSKVLDNFSNDVVAAKYEALYQSLLPA